jgi:hypothetical protein
MPETERATEVSRTIWTGRLGRLVVQALVTAMEKGAVDHDSISVHERSAKSTSSASKSSSSQNSSSKGTKSQHWSTTEDGIFVAKLTAFIYRKIITSEAEGGLKVSTVNLDASLFNAS